jgi:hypothetical protein
MEGRSDRMDLAVFLTQLEEKGVGIVTQNEEVTGEAKAIVHDWDAIQRRELGGIAPDLNVAAAEWAAVRLYRGCQALVCREMPPAEMQKMLREPCREPASVAVDYSVDLVFRFLPDLVALAKRVSRDDPLVEELLTLGRSWPLSSVGIEGIGAVDATRLRAQPGVWQLYIDRIVATSDVTRLNDEAVRIAVGAALGAFPELAPGVAAALNPTP